MSDGAHEQRPKAKLSPTAIPLSEAALLLTKMGGEPISETMLQADIEAGAPLNADGTLNLVHYGAWLVQKGLRRES